MLPRDLEIARHLATLRARFGAPLRVMYSSAKNNPDRVLEIAKVFAGAGRGCDTHLESSLQPMGEGGPPRSQQRSNVKVEAFVELQRGLNDARIPSFIELMWPLPGETLETFKSGVDRLCRLGAQAFAVYPLLWLRNTGFDGKADEHGVATLLEDDPAGSRIVIQTREVPFAAYLEGLAFATSLYLLHDCRGLFVTMQLAARVAGLRVRDAVDAFVRFLDRAAGGGPIVDLWHQGRERFQELVKFIWRGVVADAALHSARASFDALLADFGAQWIEAAPEGHRDLLAASIEFDLLHRPYVFLQTPFRVDGPGEHGGATPLRRHVARVESPYDFPRIVDRLRRGEDPSSDDLARGAFRFTLDHRTRLVFRLPSKTEPEHQWHTHQMVRGIAGVEPRLEGADSPAADGLRARS